MKLKKLEIYGFKSFAQRTEVVFNGGITGIVGPNGSGKSNIGDAVKWVLGEQNPRELRGGSMQDVIFNGTEKRKKLAYAEVTLVFDNEDGALKTKFTEVAVTRRLYRNTISIKPPADSRISRSFSTIPAWARTAIPISARVVSTISCPIKVRIAARCLKKRRASALSACARRKPSAS
mgnify:CR=1 FL=1